MSNSFSHSPWPWRAASAFFAAFAIAAVVNTYGVFSNMYDEPVTVATGMEWLSKGTFTYEPQHPPLARVASAIGPYIAGARSTGEPRMYEEGRRILGRGDHYERMLALARLGELPFFIVLLGVAWIWGRRVAGERGAMLAVFFVATNSNLLAHAGVAGIDLGPAALVPAALLAFVYWLERPDLKRAALLGFLFAVCGLTKFSGIAFLLPAVLLTLLLNWQASLTSLRTQDVARSIGIALLVAAFTTWAAYRFSFGAVPAPEFWQGLREFLKRGARGHPAFLLGEVREGGWWYYYLVVLAVKTPIPLLLLGAAGSVVAWKARASWDRAALIAGVVAVIVVACVNTVDLGVRIILPLYTMLAVLAAIGFLALWDRLRESSNRFFLAAALTWAAAEVVLTHPDHIAYFNQFAGAHPETILVDSNLDWGQDLYRVRTAVNELKMDSLRIHYFGTAEFAAVGLQRTRRLAPNERATGWVAASETFYAGVWADTALNWLHRVEPVGRIGRSIRLYYIDAARGSGESGVGTTKTAGAGNR